MEDLITFLPAWIVGFPLVMAVVIFMVGRTSEKMRNSFAVATALVTFLSVMALYPAVVTRGEVISFEAFEILTGLGISFYVDVLSFGLAALSSFVWLLVTIYSIDYMQKEHGTNRYYPVLIITLAATMGIFMAGDFFSLFVFFELMSLISYVLIVHEETPEALKAGYKYLIMTIIGGLALFFGIVITFELAGSVDIAGPALITQGSNLALLGFISYLVGFGMKAGMFPLHVWLPDAHPVAPSPASALLSGIMLKTGAYGLLRVMFHVFTIDVIRTANWHILLGVVAVITTLLGSAVALTQTDIKRRLAYSSIGQMGYILLGMAMLTERALIGDVFHIFSHAFMKSTLFLAAGAIIWKTGKREIEDWKGIGKDMPVTMAAFTMAALAMIGIPPFNGFLSKFTLSLGALDAEVPLYVLVLLISSLLNGLYYLPIIISAFFGAEEHEAHGHRQSSFRLHNLLAKEATVRMVVPVVILALATLAFGLVPVNIPYDISRMAAALLLGR